MEFFGIKARWARGLAATAAVTFALAGCGGGTEVEKFHPNRILAFGDEYSVIKSNGSKYTVNVINTTDNTIACAGNGVWEQSVSAVYGLAFDECRGTAPSSHSRILAVAGADAAGVQLQVDNFVATDQFTDKDIVTVMAGMNDVLNQYALFPATPESTLTENVKAAARTLAMQVNRIALAGPRVIVSRIPDLGASPFAKAQDAANSGRAALLNRLTTAFNTELQLNLINDGHLIGLVFGDSIMQTMLQFPAVYGLTNIDSASCADPTTAALPTCTTSTLVTGATAGSYLWAGNVIAGPSVQGQIGGAAATRALNNPF
jgi:phospholipase/lecithinase/hemolysin